MHETVHIVKTIIIDDNIQSVHLGDVVVCLNLLYNRSTNTGIPIDVFGPTWISQIFEIFDYEPVIFCGDYEKNLNMNFSFLDMMPRINTGPLNGNVSKSGFLIGKVFLHISNPQIIHFEKVIVPKTKLTKTQTNNITFFQFDSRSLHDIENKTPLLKAQQNRVIQKFKKKESNVLGIGGLETSKYLDFEFELGNIIQISQNLFNCSKFIGVDSGISHLAGTLKIPSEIVCLFNTEPRVSEILQFYSFLYPNLKIHKKDEIFKGNKCKLHL